MTNALAPAAGAQSPALKGPFSTVLLVITRRIGDVLLATPLLRSIKRAWPTARVDVMVFAGTGDVLRGNPDVGSVIEIAERPAAAQHAALIARLWRRYELALSLAPGDRPSLYAWFAGRHRAGLLLPGPKHRWKQLLMSCWSPFEDRNTHTVLMHLALADLLALQRVYEVTVAWTPEDAAGVDRLVAGAHEPLAVLHPYPKFNYKMWSRQGWIEVAHWLDARGYRVALTGSADAAELAYIADLACAMPRNTLVLAGRLTLGGVGCLLARAALYVGPDTAITHMAAALGVPTIALYGPTNPVKWGPWPRDHASGVNPWRRCGTQRAGNVTLLQGTGACVPCALEGCGRSIASHSDCLQELPAARVIAAIRAHVTDLSR